MTLTQAFPNTSDVYSHSSAPETLSSLWFQLSWCLSVDDDENDDVESDFVGGSGVNVCFNMTRGVVVVANDDIFAGMFVSDSDNDPRGLALDVDENLLVTDFDNNVRQTMSV